MVCYNQYACKQLVTQPWSHVVVPFHRSDCSGVFYRKVLSTSEESEHLHRQLAAMSALSDRVQEDKGSLNLCLQSQMFVARQNVSTDRRCCPFQEDCLSPDLRFVNHICQVIYRERALNQV